MYASLFQNILNREDPTILMRPENILSCWNLLLVGVRKSFSVNVRKKSHHFHTRS